MFITHIEIVVAIVGRETVANFRETLSLIHEKTSKQAQSKMANQNDKAEACGILRETMDAVQRIEPRSLTPERRNILVSALDEGINRLLLGQEYCIGVLKGCPRYRATIEILNAAVKPQPSSVDPEFSRAAMERFTG